MNGTPSHQVLRGLKRMMRVYMQPIQVHDGVRYRTESMTQDERDAVAWLEAQLKDHGL